MSIETNKAEIRGRIQGLNYARIMVWGIGYDKDETAQMMRRELSNEIIKLQAMLDIDDATSGLPAGEKGRL